MSVCVPVNMAVNSFMCAVLQGYLHISALGLG